MPMPVETSTLLKEYIDSLDQTKVGKSPKKLLEKMYTHLENTKYVFTMEDVKQYTKTEYGIEALETLDREMEGDLLKDVKKQILQNFFEKWNRMDEQNMPKKMF